MQERFAELNPKYQLKFVNIALCNLNISNGEIEIEIKQQKYKENKPIIVNQNLFKTNNYTQEFTITGSCVNNTKLKIQTNKKQTIFLYKIGSDLDYKSLEFDHKGLSIGKSQLKFVSINTNSMFNKLKPNTNLELKENKKFIVQNLDESFNSSFYLIVDYKNIEFEITDKSSTLLNGNLLTENCGRYTVVLFPNAKNQTMLDYTHLVDITPNGLKIFWQLIQIIGIY